jgi:ABC-type nitrate/sulfonate/bicarbonate transport system substrate-binding protein
MTIIRRNFLQFLASLTAASAIPAHSGEAEASQQVRVATGLLAMWQSTAWLGAEAGIFKKHGVDLSVTAIAIGGPQAAAGVIGGQFEFAHTGALPVAEEVLKGNDIVILATPTIEFPNQFVMTRKEITELGQLGGRKVGVLTETGQTSRATRIAIEKAGATAIYLSLVRFDRIFDALANGEIDAGALPVDLRFVGASRYGWNAFPLHEFGTPSIFASTRKLIASDRDLVRRVMRGFVETIYLFKTQPDVALPLLQRYLNIDNRSAAEDLYRFHVPVFQETPKPLLGNLQNLRDVLVVKYPAAVSLKEADIADVSFIEEMERDGFIESLYGSKMK